VDDVILVSDQAFGGADTLATSLVLAETIRKISEKFGPVDLVICGKQTIDGDTAQVGPGIAMRLGLSQLTLVDQVVEVDPEKLTVTVRRKLEGRKEIALAKLPALMTVVREINLPRYPIVNRRLLAELAEIPIWTNELLKLPTDQIGLKGSPTNVKKIFAPERKIGEILGDGEKDPAGAVNLLIQKLAEKKLIAAAS
jgi:electron transfer flavoprotein beta subunit